MEWDIVASNFYNFKDLIMIHEDVAIDDNFIISGIMAIW
jgi:hypothetical protein